jgi:hypothetical protein
MNKVILTINGTDIGISGDLNVIEKCIGNVIKSLTEKTQTKTHQEINKIISTTPVKKTETTPKFSREDNIKFYQYLQNNGNYSINQFEITRGGQANQQQYTVCTVFDNNQRRYMYYNPKSEDKFIATFSPIEAVKNLQNNVEGFHLLHQVAAGIQAKGTAITDIVAVLEKHMTTKDDVVFKDYDSKDKKQPKKVGKKS